MAIASAGHGTDAIEPNRQVMGRPRIRGGVSLAAALTMAVSVAPASTAGAPGPGQDAHYFRMKAKASGEYSADFANDRLMPGQTTASGVDGVETGSWSWSIRAVGRSVGDGPLRSAAAEFRGIGKHSAEIISYGIQMGQLSETQLCEGVNEPPSHSVTSWEREPSGVGPANWIYSPNTAIRYGSGGFAVGYPPHFSLVGYCFHGIPPGLSLHSFIVPTDTPVPRGGFEPRSDRSFSASWSDSVNDIDYADGSAVHTETGSSELKITVKAISKRKATKKRDKYRDPDPRDGIYNYY